MCSSFCLLWLFVSPWDMIINEYRLSEIELFGCDSEKEESWFMILDGLRCVAFICLKNIASAWGFLS